MTITTSTSKNETLVVSDISFYLYPHCLTVRESLQTSQMTLRIKSLSTWGCRRRRVSLWEDSRQGPRMGFNKSSTPSANNFKTIVPDLFKFFWKAPAPQRKIAPLSPLDGRRLDDRRGLAVTNLSTRTQLIGAGDTWYITPRLAYYSSPDRSKTADADIVDCSWEDHHWQTPGLDRSSKFPMPSP